MGPEARIPCPQCGGPIHPVAGRCKHCKTDLVALRTGKPQAAASLPSLGNRTVNERAIGRPPAMRPGRMPHVDPMTATFSMGSQLPSTHQVLPPRPTGRMMAAAPEVAAWPMIVIAMSVVAIILAIGALAA